MKSDGIASIYLQYLTIGIYRIILSQMGLTFLLLSHYNGILCIILDQLKPNNYREH